MTTVLDDLEQFWCARVSQDVSGRSKQEQSSIVSWLLGENRESYQNLTINQLAIAKQAMEYRYRILRQRYLGVGPTQAYKNLINRLGSLVMLRNKIKTWVSLSRDRQRAVADVIQEIIQEMLNRDRYLQEQIAWIGQCTQDKRLKEALLLATVEEYCLRPIRNQPLLLYRFVNYLRRSQRGGLTQVPQAEKVRLLSEALKLDDTDSPISLLDNQAIADYEEQQASAEQQSLRVQVKQEFSDYLAEKVGDDAVLWLNLYLQGKTQEQIAQNLNVPIKQVYRLREKVSYHAIKVFALKNQPELVANWLQVSLQEHNLGLTSQQWQQFWQDLTPIQQQLIHNLQQGSTWESIAEEFHWKLSQVMGEWSKLYLAAQAIRSASKN